MKRTYIKPAVEVVDLETKATCVIASWNVDGGKNPDDHGYIIEDNGAGSFDNPKDDPWDSTNW